LAAIAGIARGILGLGDILLLALASWAGSRGRLAVIGCRYPFYALFDTLGAPFCNPYGDRQ
jgi:hypothetical protein